MATQNGDNFQKTQNDPVDKLDPGELNGRVKILKESRLLDSELANGEFILGPSLPASAKVIDAKLTVSGALGGTGRLDLGHVAFTDNSDAAVAADQNAFIDQLNATGGAVNARLANEAGLDLEMGQADVQVRVQNTIAATTSAVGKTISWYILYTLD